MNTVENYTKDMADAMKLIAENIGKPEEERDEFFARFLEIRSDVVAVATYDSDGNPHKAVSVLADSHLVHISRDIGKADIHNHMLFPAVPKPHFLGNRHHPGIVLLKKILHMGFRDDQ